MMDTSAMPCSSLRPWSPCNPYTQRVAKRLTAMGGPHAPSTVANDRIVMAEEEAVVLMRALPAAQAEQATPF